MTVSPSTKTIFQSMVNGTMEKEGCFLSESNQLSPRTHR